MSTAESYIGKKIMHILINQSKSHNTKNLSHPQK